MKTYRITGQDAIRLAERDTLTLKKFADPIDGARTVTPSEARDIAREDGGLIYVDVQPTGWTSDETGYNVCDYFDHGGAYNGPDVDGVEPTWADVCEVSTDVSATQDSIILRKRGFLPIANHRADRPDDSLTLWTNFRTGERAISTNGDPVFGGQAGYQHTLETCFPDVAAYSTPHDGAKSPRFQIYCDRGDGPTLDGSWGSEHAQFDTEEEAQEAIDGEIGLAANYPDVEWLIMPIESANE